ncbi:glycyl-radical enzyme activating protein [uncultured Mailhella sp.]|uniref:glycyl-radical enzyme activating protein n=1 Tax=uncultured Mailhella sp. TaxID=1981031 RepID=UPI00262FD801|nr:glycyl-radical enzyme activating protein [uncultured Mailhella sp.]
MNKITGTVVNIQKFSVHDGDGIRTVVFLKGCPLRCSWCSNPETQSFRPEHGFLPLRCISPSVCGRCFETCTTEAMHVSDGVLSFDSSRCLQCMECVRNCPGQAQVTYGELLSVEEVLQKVEEDTLFYEHSHGGMTLSGGEALAQPEFALALLREAHRRHIHTAIETCGCIPWHILEDACRYLNQLLYDVKCIDPLRHKEFTGQDNALILENLHKVAEHFPELPITVRTPVIPGFNDTCKAIAAIKQHLPNKGRITYELLPFHRMGESKYAALGRGYDYANITPDSQYDERMQELQRIAHDKARQI